MVDSKSAAKYKKTFSISSERRPLIDFKDLSLPDDTLFSEEFDQLRTVLLVLLFEFNYLFPVVDI